MVRLCVICDKERAIIKRPKTSQQLCKECFYYVFETEIHNAILDNKLFKKGDRVAIAASGGKGNGAKKIFFFQYFTDILLK
jgi:cytoplasmic tRNA 2-thiolation protein 1